MSEKPLAERLQIKGNRRVALAGTTPSIDQAVGAATPRAEIAQADIILLAAPDLAHLQATLPPILAAARPGAILWIAYPKLTFPLAANLNRDIIRTLAPTHGLQTVSQIAIDSDWSALRLKRT